MPARPGLVSFEVTLLTNSPTEAWAWEAARATSSVVVPWAVATELDGAVLVVVVLVVVKGDEAVAVWDGREVVSTLPAPAVGWVSERGTWETKVPRCSSLDMNGFWCALAVELKSRAWLVIVWWCRVKVTCCASVGNGEAEDGTDAREVSCHLPLELSTLPPSTHSPTGHP